MQTTFFYLGIFLKKLADDQCSSITKDSIYHINHMYILSFTTVVDWPEIWWLMDVSAMFYFCRYCVFTWDGTHSLHEDGWELISFVDTIKIETCGISILSTGVCCIECGSIKKKYWSSNAKLWTYLPIVWNNSSI